MSDPQKLPDRIPTLRLSAMPADTNQYGDIFGGWLIGQMDLAAGSIASRHSRGRAVTAAVDAVSLDRPVHVGDEVTIYADLVHVGRSSMKIDVEAWRRPYNGDEAERVTRAEFTFVAIDKHRRPREIVRKDD